MKAIIGERYGSPDTLELREVELPALDPERVLVRVRAASVNAGDWRVMRGSPVLARPLMGGLLRPKERRRGSDIAGVVQAVGESVTEFQPGDEVFGSARGAFAEYAAPLERGIVRKPAHVAFEQAAAIPAAGVTALQAVRDHGRLEPGQRVLVNGTGGGVGTFLVQIAKALGGHVTAVCGAHNVEMIHSIGADRVVDYTAEDFTRAGGPYDLVLDNAGTRSIRKLRRLLTPTGTLVVVGALKNPLGHLASAAVQNRFVSQRLVGFIAKLNQDDLRYLAGLAEAGTIAPVIDRTYPLAETAAAYRYLEGWHARGKVVITVQV